MSWTPTYTPLPLAQPCLVPVSAKLWAVVVNWHPVLAWENEVLDVEILPGMLTDGASIPRFFWRVIGHPMMPIYVAPGLTHDDLYQTQWMSRDKADWWLWAALRANGVSAELANTIHRGVRLGGWRAWNYYTAHPDIVQWAREHTKLDGKLLSEEAA